MENKTWYKLDRFIGWENFLDLPGAKDDDIGS